MATAPILEIVPDTGTDIALVVQQNPGIVLLDSAKFEDFYTRMKAETDKLVPDVTTAKGRDEIRSVAARVVRAKTSIDKARLGLTKEWRDNTKLANEAGKVIEERLDGLADEVRKPLTEWEEAEKARLAECDRIIAEIGQAAVVTLDDTAAGVRERGGKVWSTALDPTVFGDRLPEAKQAKDAAVEAIKSALARLTREEADRAELDKLRAAAAEREARELAEQQAAEQAAAEAAEIQRQKDQIERDRQEESEKIAAAERAAEQRARDRAEQAAQADRDRVQKEHDDALAAERAKVIEAELVAQAERDRAEQIERDRLAKEAAARAEEQLLADEQAARDKSQANRTRVKTAAKIAIMACGVSEDAAVKVVKAIIDGAVPAVSLRF